MTTAREQAREAAHRTIPKAWIDSEARDLLADAASDVWERLVADLIDLAEHSCQDANTGEYCTACEAALQRAHEAINDDDS